MNELQPTFTLTLFLDGDDDVELQTKNAFSALTESLEEMCENRAIVGYTIDLPE